MNQTFPHPTVGALIFNPEGKLLLVRSHKFHDKYVVPGGHIEVGEKMTDALIREAKEETGLDIYDLEFIFFQEFIQDKSFWKNMHFIFFDFACKTDSSEVTLNEEAQSYVWVTLEEALALPIDSYTGNAIRELMKKKNNLK
ncbi:MAG: NUDIX domain-containing protein [Anaerolineae bacterium]|jgi:nucleoside triphosphatase|nr:NUDIX domain-containing protein [Anaerolineae bacterium]MBT4310328.1 NUDIX domain-containing protein [Anaerolineae bacterium]MBT4457465.1 NUDIX domain-containing protein [Anaerolineae bacterium]MBT6061581.1 NUDIX domain-containing protein [Anaerolineae bacterium]MBT6321118.1 NUDIX domain-containing protein [Anaerolineae bacterium]